MLTCRAKSGSRSALTYIYGIGLHTSQKLLQRTGDQPRYARAGPDG